MILLNYIVGWLSRGFLAGLPWLQYLAKNMALLVQTFLEDFFLSKSVFGYSFVV